MPELPEVETVVRGLRASLTGRTIIEVGVHWAGSIGAPDAQTFKRCLTGKIVTGLDRRGKWIVIGLNKGYALLVHLRMTGQLLLESVEHPVDKYTRVVLTLDGGERLRFSDMRKFGRLILTEDVSEVLADLGPEPLADDFTTERFTHMLAQRRGRIKSLLLDQRFLVGLGNIYVNEVLWRAGIHPLRAANDLSPVEVKRLHQAIRHVLRAAIAEGGTTLENGNFKQADGEPGQFANELLVYGRDEEPCAACRNSVMRIKVGQRGTYFCPQCQPLLPGD